GPTTFKTSAAVIAASTALPPSCRTLNAAAEANGWLVATMPFVARTGDRVPFGLNAGRSPCALITVAVMMIPTHADLEVLLAGKKLSWIVSTQPLKLLGSIDVDEYSRRIYWYFDT